MTRSVVSSNGQQSGSKAVEPKATGPASAPVTARTLRAASWMKLSRGMAIRAAIEVRLLGKRLLTLNADITVLPAEETGTRLRSAPHRDGERLRLADAARTLEAAASDLDSACKRAP